MWRRGRDPRRTLYTANPLNLFTFKIFPTLQADDCVSLIARCNLDTDQIPPVQKPEVGGVEFAIFGHLLRPVSRTMMRGFAAIRDSSVSDRLAAISAVVVGLFMPSAWTIEKQTISY